MKSSEPKYMALYQQLKAEILTGKYPTDSYLPVEEDLISLYKASRTTVRHAVALLKSENLVDVKQGSGTRVLPVASFPNDFKKFRNYNQIDVRFLVDGDYEISAIGSVIDIVTADNKIANNLRLNSGDKVYRLQKLQAINDVPFAYMVHYLKPDILVDLERYNGQISNLASFLKKEYGITISTSEETISAVQSGFVDSRMLNVDVGSPLLAFYRLSYFNSEPIEYGETLIRPDLFEIVVTMDGGASFISQ